MAKGFVRWMAKIEGKELPPTCDPDLLILLKGLEDNFGRSLIGTRVVDLVTMAIQWDTTPDQNMWLNLHECNTRVENRHIIALKKLIEKGYWCPRRSPTTGFTTSSAPIESISW